MADYGPPLHASPYPAALFFRDSFTRGVQGGWPRDCQAGTGERNQAGTTVHGHGWTVPEVESGEEIGLDTVEATQ
jgi:hypothetical protein